MATEIERKYLLSSDAWRALVSASVRMRQGYLCPAKAAKASVRVRVSESEQGSEAMFNVKAAVLGSSRAEYEYPMPLADAHEMLSTLCVGLIEKTRHHVHYQGHLWEIDEFAGDNAGLIVAEIELQAEDEAFARPDWLGEDVTEDIRYYNNMLAQHPWRTWPQA